jgi:hypothetical protein
VIKQIVRHHRIVRLTDTNGRNSDLVTFNELVSRSGTGSIDPDFSLAKGTIDPGSGDTLELAQQEIIDSLARVRGFGGYDPHPG